MCSISVIEDFEFNEFLSVIGGYDHTYKTEAGHFLQMYSNDVGPGAHNTAKLNLPLLRNVPSGDYCFQLYYIRLGSAGTGTLSIHVSYGCWCYTFVLCWLAMFGLVKQFQVMLIYYSFCSCYSQTYVVSLIEYRSCRCVHTHHRELKITSNVIR